MRPLKVRQGAIGGAVVSFITAGSVAGRSADPLPALVGVLVVGLSVTGLVTLMALAINRPSQPPIRW